MRAVIQRVANASVTVNRQIKGKIERGLVVLLAIEEADTPQDIEWLSGKIVRLRIFDDDSGVMNRSITEIGGEILAVSQFTLYASTKKGARPSYGAAAPPEIAQPRFDGFVSALERERGGPVPKGVFGAHMQVALVNDGPVTLLLDSRRLF